MKKGQTNNPNGRPAGTPNKITKELRSILKAIVARELENLDTLLDGLDGKDRLDVVLKLLPYVLPKVEPVSMAHGEPADYSFMDLDLSSLKDVNMFA